MSNRQRFIHLASTFAIALTWMLGCSSSTLVKENSPADPNMCRIVVVQDKNSSQALAHVSVSNNVELSGMTLPFRYGNGQSPVRCDSIRFWDTRSQFFEMKTGRIDTVEQTVLIGLIADMSGSKSPLEPGEGDVARIYFTLPQGKKFQDFVMDTTWIRPFNMLKFVTPQVEGIFPAFDNSKATIKGGIPVPPPEKANDKKKKEKPAEGESEQGKQAGG
jgi:hypothetical protein